MIILVVCVDAQAVRYALFDMASGEELLGSGRVPVNTSGHGAATRVGLDQLLNSATVKDRGAIGGIGVLVPHAGEMTAARPIDDVVRAAMAANVASAPVHNPACLSVLDTLAERLPGVPQVAVFDTAFAATIPTEAREGSPRCGFHGERHRYIATRMVDLAPTAVPGRQRVISCHLGAESSVYALVNRQALANSCGRGYGSGLPTYAISAEQNHATDEGGEASRRDLAALVEAVRLQVKASLAVLEGADAICFSGALGQGSPSVRSEVVRGLTGSKGGQIVLDEVKNEATRDRGRIDAEGSAVQVWVLPAFEEVIIARQTLETLNDVEARRSMFTKIYRRNHWQGESKSGTGSDLEQTQAIRTALREVVRDLNIKTLLDAPCGDFYWMQVADLPLERYIGADIVPALIAENQQRYGRPGKPGGHAGEGAREFVVRDIVKETLPRVDAIFCRDCLVHLTFADIQAALRNFQASGSKYLLTTTFTNHPENSDIYTGMWRPLNLQRPPFNLPPPLRLLDEHCTEEGYKYADKCIGVWELGKIAVG